MGKERWGNEREEELEGKKTGSERKGRGGGEMEGDG
jgi:hypothetical protein